MAGWSRFPSSLVICILVSQISINFFMYDCEQTTRQKLHVLSVSQHLNCLQVVTRTTYAKTSSKKTFNMASSKPVTVMKFLNIMLAVNLVLLANDVPQNPGPVSQMPSKMKDLRVFHLNIRSLRNEMVEL